MFQLVQSLEEAEHPGFPRDTRAKPWTLRLHTENVARVAEEITLLRGGFLPRWRERLAADSPMTELVDLYVRGAQPVVRHADAVLAAWEQITLPESTTEEIGYRNRYRRAVRVAFVKVPVSQSSGPVRRQCVYDHGDLGGVNGRRRADSEEQRAPKRCSSPPRRR